MYCAGIVTYNPDIERLNENILAIYKQVRVVFVVDNGSNNIDQIEKICSVKKNTYLIKNNKNLGIASALNRIMCQAKNAGASWCLLLDQDSIPPIDIIDRYEKNLYESDVSILCPRIYDMNSSHELIECDGLEQVGVCITSGSFNNVEIWDKVGGFDERLFIDSVDNEYCIRLFFCGYKIYRDNSIVLLHELGKRENHFYKAATNHNQMRRYYIARNSIYVAKKYKAIAMKHDKKNYKIQNAFLDKLISPTRIYLRQIQFIVIIILYEKQKREKIEKIIKGLKDGNKMYKDLRTLK